MFSKKQVKAIIDTLKNPSIDGRPNLQQVFEQAGYLWATDGYVALELGKGLEGKRITLERLAGWYYGTHGTKSTLRLEDLAEDNDLSVPDMAGLLHHEYGSPKEIKIDLSLLKLAGAFLGEDRVRIDEKGHCFRISPLDDGDNNLKAYVMGLR